MGEERFPAAVQQQCTRCPNNQRFDGAKLWSTVVAQIWANIGGDRSSVLEGTDTKPITRVNELMAAWQLQLWTQGVCSKSMLALS